MTLFKVFVQNGKPNKYVVLLSRPFYCNYFVICNFHFMLSPFMLYLKLIALTFFLMQNQLSVLPHYLYNTNVPHCMLAIHKVAS